MVPPDLKCNPESLLKRNFLAMSIQLFFLSGHRKNEAFTTLTATDVVSTQEEPSKHCSEGRAGRYMTHQERRETQVGKGPSPGRAGASSEDQTLRLTAAGHPTAQHTPASGRGAPAPSLPRRPLWRVLSRENRGHISERLWRITD